MLRRLASEGCAVVVSGHEMQTLFDVSDRLVWCTDGTTYEYSSPEAAWDNWRFQRGYLGWA